MSTSSLKEIVLFLKPFTDTFILAVMLLAMTFVMYRIKMKIDLTGVLTLAIMLFAAFVRFIMQFFDNGSTMSGTFQTVQGVCQILVWFSLYYFTFEMEKIQVTLTSLDNPRSHINKHFRHKIVKLTLMSLLIGYILLYITGSILVNLENMALKFYKGLDYLELSMKSVKFVMDTFMHYLFLSLLFFFIQFKLSIAGKRS